VQLKDDFLRLRAEHDDAVDGREAAQEENPAKNFCGPRSAIGVGMSTGVAG
jgi:hypothetical protein